VYRVYGSPLSRLTRVTWMLEELGEPYEIVKMELGGKELRALNPSGKGPVLADGGFILPDSAAICLYLADKHADKGFGPNDARERALMESWMLFALAELEAPLWNKLKHRFLLPEELRAEIGPWAAAEFARECRTLGKRLGDNAYAMGDRFTCVDVVLGHCGMWARSGKFEIAPEPVVAYFERVVSRSAYKRAVEKEQALKAGG
jgi:glutathione S-transferase